MPPFDTAPELLARIENVVEVVLVVHRACQAVAKHPFGERRQRIGGVLFEKRGRRRRIALKAIIWRRSELVEFILSCADSISVGHKRETSRDIPPAMDP